MDIFIRVAVIILLNVNYITINTNTLDSFNSYVRNNLQLGLNGRDNISDNTNK